MFTLKKSSLYILAFLKMTLVCYVITTVIIFYFTVFGERVCDFVQLYTASHICREGTACDVYNVEYFSREIAARGMGELSIPFMYPPVGLLLFYPLSIIPYGLAFVLWTLVGAGSFFCVCRKICLPEEGHNEIGRRILLVAMASPAIICNISYGNNGLFIAAVTAMAILSAQSNPMLSGFFAGVLIYKPNLAIILPFFFLISANYKALKSFFITSAIAVFITCSIWGTSLWSAFLFMVASSGQGKYVSHSKIYTVISLPHSLRTLLSNGNAALFIQGVVSIFSLCAMYLVLRKYKSIISGHLKGPGNPALRTCPGKTIPNLVSALIPVTLLVVTPYSQIYDLALLNLAVVFYLGYMSDSPSNHSPLEWLFLLLLWLVPALQLPIAYWSLNRFNMVFSISVPLLIAFNCLIIGRLWYNDHSLIENKE